MSAGTPLVEVRDLCKHFPVGAGATVHAVESVSLQIGRGETLAVVGESGCGKSTVIALLQRFYDPDAGAVRLDGVDLTYLNLSWLRSQLGLVGQEPMLFDGRVRVRIQNPYWRYSRLGYSRVSVSYKHILSI